MENKQTAVEWLIKELHLQNSKLNAGIIQQAMELEKAQIKKAFDDALVLKFYDRCLDPEYYYQKTYKPKTDGK